MDKITSYVKTFALNLKAKYDKSSFKQVVTKVKDDLKEVEELPVKFDNAKLTKELKDAVEEARSQVGTVLDFANSSDTLSKEEKEAFSKKYDEQVKTLYKIKKIQDEIVAQEMFGKDTKTLEKLKEQLEELKKEAKKVGLVRDSNGNFKQKTAEDQKEIDKEQEEMNEQGTETSNFSSGWKEAKENWASEHTPEEYGKKAFQKMTDSIEQFKDKALETFKSFVKDALKELEEMASWDIGGSTQYNKEASEIYMNYGLQGADAYAMSKALEDVGIDDIETYLTDPMVQSNKALLNSFDEHYKLAKSQYKEDLEIAKEYQKFKEAFGIFKDKLQKSLIDFFMENKDNIMNILNFLMQSMQYLVSLVGDIVAFFGGNTMEDRSDEQKQSDMNELLGVTNNSTISYDNRSNHVNVNNTYNGVGKVDQGILQNVGQLTYQQIIEYFGREG